MMKRLLIFFALLIAFGAPALAQNAGVDPAAYLPGDFAAYLEVRADDAGGSALEQIMRTGTQLSGMALTPEGDALALAFNPLLSPLLPGMDFATDVQPWLGDRFALAAISPPASSPGASNYVFVLPIGDSAAARAFVDQIAARSAERDLLPNAVLYFGGIFSLASSDGVIWLGSPDAVNKVVRAYPQTLAENPAFQKVRAALPPDAALSAYVSGTFLSAQLAQSQQNIPPDQPSLTRLAETALRLHPAQSAAEDALLQSPALNGIGFALQVGADRFDLTSILSLDAQYPAPTLTTATAGTALLDLIPGDSFAVFASYDVSVLALPIAGLALLGPTVGNIFDEIVAGLGPSDFVATPTPTPTPTPAPPLTADAIIAQVQPLITQAESLMGMSLDELYSLTDGEYAVAVFPGAGPTIGAALYLQSSDPQRLIDTLDHVSRLILTDPAAGTRLVGVEHTSIDGVDVALLGTPGAGERPALGILDGSVLFLTMEGTVSKVIAGANSPNPSSPVLNWRAAFGAGQEALFYVDPRMVDLYSLRQQRIPPLPVTALAGSFDVRDDGLFVLRLTLTAVS